MARADSSSLTYDDLRALPEDGQRHELLAGLHVVTPPPGAPRLRAMISLAMLLTEAVEGRGKALLPPLDVVLAEDTVVEPDVTLVLDAGGARITETHVAGAPDLIVEVLSDATEARDLGAKTALYERHGITEYWTVDPRTRTLEQRRLAAGRYGEPNFLLADETLRTPLLPGFELRASRLFR